MLSVTSRPLSTCEAHVHSGSISRGSVLLFWRKTSWCRDGERLITRARRRCPSIIPVSWLADTHDFFPRPGMPHFEYSRDAQPFYICIPNPIFEPVSFSISSTQHSRNYHRMQNLYHLFIVLYTAKALIYKKMLWIRTFITAHHRYTEAHPSPSCIISKMKELSLISSSKQDNCADDLHLIAVIHPKRMCAQVKHRGLSITGTAIESTEGYIS